MTLVVRGLHGTVAAATQDERKNMTSSAFTVARALWPLTVLDMKCSIWMAHP